MNNAKLLSMFGSVAEVVIAARLFCLQRFKVCDLTLAMVPHMCWPLFREFGGNEWDARVKTLAKYWLRVVFLFASVVSSNTVLHCYGKWAVT